MSVEVLVIGGTGYTGLLTTRRLAHNYPDLTWALAGRSESALIKLADQIKSEFPKAKPPAVIKMDLGNQESVDAAVKQAKVVLTMAGPFTQMGEPVVAACAKFGVHYCDVNAEPHWAAKMALKYDSVALGTKAKIVTACGFDSIPSDYGTYQVWKTLAAKGKGEYTLGRTRTFFCGDGFASKGSAVSIANEIGRLGKNWFTRIDCIGESKIELAPEEHPAAPKFVPEYKKYTSPWTMDYINGRVVYRSHAKKFNEDGVGYGPKFTYSEAQLNPFLKAWILFLVLALSYFLVLSTTIRNFLFKVLPPADKSPLGLTDQWTLITEAEKVDKDGKVAKEKVECMFVTKGTGYDATAYFVVEAALTLLKDTAKLPKRYGVLTPTEALGDAFLERLHAHASDRVFFKVE